MTDVPDIAPPIADVFDHYPEDLRDRLITLRRLIFDLAAQTEGVGPVTETLKWGQPSYSVPSGTPLRLGVTKSGDPALFAHCQTRVISDARAVFEGALQFEGNRAVVLPVDMPIASGELGQVILSALTYRL